jgi:hypothetical protein
MEPTASYLPEIDELIEFYCVQRKSLAAGPAKARVLSKIYMKHQDSDAQKIIRAIIVYTRAYSRVAKFFARPIFAAPFLLSALVFSGGGLFLMMYLQAPVFGFAVAAGLVASQQALCRFLRASTRYIVEAAFCDELREGLLVEV